MTTKNTSVNSLSNLAEAINLVGGKPSKASYNANIQMGNVSSAKTKVWAPDVIKSKLAVSLAMDKHCLLVGPTGTGKSTIARAVLEASGSEFFRFQGFEGFSAEDWFGSATLDDNGKIVIQYSEIVRAMEEGLPVIVEELNLISPMNMGPLFSMLDDGKFMDITIAGKTKRINKKPGFILLATGNDNGSGDNLHIYSGGHILNKAVVSRLNVINIGYLPEAMEMEMIIEKSGVLDQNLLRGMLNVAKETRRVADSEPSKAELAISPRQMIDWARAYAITHKEKAKLTHKDIAEMILVDRLPASLQETVTTMVINKLSTIKIKDISTI